MRLSRPLDKILNSEIKVRILRVFCRTAEEVSGRQIAKRVGVSPKAAHEALQDLLGEGLLLMRSVGKTYLFRLNEDLEIVRSVLRFLFVEEEGLKRKLFGAVSGAIKQSPLKDDILSVAVFGSVHAETERSTSDVDLLVVVKAGEFKKKVENLFFEIDQRLSSRWGNLLSPYVSSLAEFKSKAKKKEGIVSQVLKSYRLIYGDRLEKLLR